MSLTALAENPFSGVVGNYVVTGCKSKTLAGAGSAYCLDQLKAFCVRVSNAGNVLAIREGFGNTADPLFASTVREYKSNSGSFVALENGASFRFKPDTFTSSVAIIMENGRLIHREEIFNLYLSHNPPSVIGHMVRDYHLKPAPPSLAKRFEELCGAY